MVEGALRPTSPVSPKHKLDLALGLLLGLIAGVVLASLRDQARDRIQAPPLVARSLDAPILGSIPRTHRLLVGTAHLASVDEPHGQTAEAYRTLRTNLLAVCRESKAKTILITSARQGEGKTSTAANLAVALAQAGGRRRHSPLRNPRVHAVFGIGNEQGLGQVLEGTLPLDEAMVETDLPELRILPSGPVDAVDEPVELLQSDRMGEVLQECCRSDFVVVDGPPIFPVADSLVLADLVDGVLFVTDAQSSTQASVAQSRRQIHQVGGRILGGESSTVCPPPGARTVTTPIIAGVVCSIGTCFGGTARHWTESRRMPGHPRTTEPRTRASGSGPGTSMGVGNVRPPPVGPASRST